MFVMYVRYVQQKSIEARIACTTQQRHALIIGCCGCDCRNEFVGGTYCTEDTALFLDHTNSCYVVLRISSRTTILDQHTLVSHIIRIPHRRVDTNIGSNTSKDDITYPLGP
jgi:hypothetical protein